jgi:GTP-binding protein LepA
MTGALSEREMDVQVLDTMELERERGITIKAQAVRLVYKYKDGEEYILNLIDTPGHVDFTYEVSKSLAACEGALLVVDASQGIQAQTLANLYLALEQNLEIIPVINKIDLPGARPDWVKKQIEEVIGLDAEDAPLISAKNGIGIEAVLDSIIEKIPPPIGSDEAPLRALIFDSFYDNYRGVIAYIRVKEGTIKPGDRIMIMSNGKEFEVTDVGVFRPFLSPVQELRAGDVGYISAGIKSVRDTRVGDTITHANRPAGESLPGYKHMQPMVYCGIYPAEGAKYEDLREALEKLQLNDADSAADFWACCIWKLFRNAWRGNMTWIWLLPRQALYIELKNQTGNWWRFPIPPICHRRLKWSILRNPRSVSKLYHQTNMSGRLWSYARNVGESTSIWSILRAPGFL